MNLLEDHMRKVIILFVFLWCGQALFAATTRDDYSNVRDQQNYSSYYSNDNEKTSSLRNTVIIDFGDILIGNSNTVAVIFQIILTDTTTLSGLIYDTFPYVFSTPTSWITYPPLQPIPGPTLPPGFYDCQMQLTFTPDSIGYEESALEIFDYDNRDILYSAILCGRGLGAYIVSDTSSLNFGDVTPGCSDTLSLQITNESGNINLEISDIIDATDNYFYFIAISDSTIPPDSSSIMQIEFSPQEYGIFNDTLFIISNACNEDTLKIALWGEASIAVDDNESHLHERLFNVPNPFKKQTIIHYSISKPNYIKIQIYNIKGQLIKILVDQQKNKGNYSVDFNAEGLSSGIYFYSMEVANKRIVKKMILLR